MSQIDKYITRATAGLPSRERIDTAAELRVHLNAQVKKHMLEGHTSEEAEFLAVDAMGAVAKVNRQFLGHIFTPRVGWGVLIASVIGLAGWFVWMNQERWFMTKGSITEVSGSKVREIAFSTGLSTVAWDIVAPLGTKEIQYALITPNQEAVIGKVMPQDMNKIMKGESRKTRLYVSSDLSNGDKCGKIIVGSGASPINRQICIPQAVSPGGSISPSAVLYSPYENPQLNHWMPLWIIKPQVVEKQKDTWSFTENQRATSWTALFINFSDTSDGCTNCIPNRKYLKLRDTGDHSYPKLLLDLNDSNSKFFDIIDFRVPQGTQKIDLAILRGEQKPTVVENAIETRANQKLLGSFGLNRFPKDQDTSDVWSIFLDYANNGANGTLYSRYNVLQEHPTVSAPEYAVPDLQVDPSIGEYSTPLLLPAKIPLDAWIPVWALPTHEGNNIGRTFEGNRSWSNVNPDPNRWYIVYMRFLSQPVSSVTEKIIFPKYKIKNLKDYSVNINQLDIQK